MILIPAHQHCLSRSLSGPQHCVFHLPRFQCPANRLALQSQNSILICLQTSTRRYAWPCTSRTLHAPDNQQLLYSQAPLNISDSSILQKFLPMIVCCATEEGSPVIIFARSRVEEEVASDQLKHHACQRPHVCWGGVLSAQEHLTSAQQSFLQVLTHQ